MKTLLAFLSIALFSSTAVYAATAKFVKATPTDDSVSDTPPSAIVLEFSEAVQLHQVFIKKDNGKSTHLSRDLIFSVFSNELSESLRSRIGQ